LPAGGHPGVQRPAGRGEQRGGADHFDAMARDTIAFVEAVPAAPVDLVGCSDGATVALLVAWLRPDLVKRLVFVCGVFHHEGWLPRAIELDEEPDAFLGDWYGEVSPDGREHRPVVKVELCVAHLTEPALTPRDLARVTCPTLVMQGDRDERPELCNAIIGAFLR
jgi:pimeloyl-ACP methyl ester carboxylesterase